MGHVQIDGNIAFRDLLLVTESTLANVQKILEELEKFLMMNSPLPYRSNIAHSVPSTPPSLDYSAYFEPIVAPARFTSERTNGAAYCEPDFDDCFEPVTRYQLS